MLNFTQQYHQLLNTLLSDGMMQDDPNRKGVQRLQIPFYDITVDIEDSFPAITTKPLYFKGVVEELLWFLKGDTNAATLREKGVHIWDGDAKRWGSDDLGKIYGKQWRRWTNIRPSGYIHPLMHSDFAIDQIYKLIEEIKHNPLSSSLVVTAWNPAEINEAAVPPCHYGFQVTLNPTGHGYYELNLIFNMRSSDVLLGLPFNVASYALLAYIISYFVSSKELKVFPRYLKYSGTNVHLYDNQLSAASEQLERDPLRFAEPSLDINFGGYRYLDEWLEKADSSVIALFDYNHYKPIPEVEMLTYNK